MKNYDITLGAVPLMALFSQKGDKDEVPKALISKSLELFIYFFNHGETLNYNIYLTNLS